MIRNWSLLSRSREVIALVLAVEIVAAALLVGCFLFYPVPAASVLGLCVLGLCSLIEVELSRRVVRLRERHRDTPHKTFHAVWLLPAALLLPPGLVAVLVLATYAFVWTRIYRHTPHRWVYSAATALLGYTGASIAYHAMSGSRVGTLREGGLGVLTALAAGALALGVNYLLVAAAIRLSVGGVTRKQAFGDSGEQLIEVSSICLGLLVAEVFTVEPYLAPAALPVVALLQRTVLFAQLQRAARTDAKTGLANVAWWHELAEREVGRGRRLGEPVSVLIADLDHFKRVNDTHGHLAGDAVLRGVAAEFTAELREYDVVGRFGGEEFVVVLPATGLDRARGVAERLRRRVAALAVEVPGQVDADGRPARVAGVTVSIGLATAPGQAEDLTGLLRCADAALYAAKAAGRNRIASAPPDLAGRRDAETAR